MPAVRALIHIGAPSIPAVTRNITDSDDKEVRYWSVFALYGIEGRDKDVTRFRLQKMLDVQSDPAKKARVQLALEVKLDRDSEDPFPTGVIVK
jgi:HEAT repeat protein